MEFQRINGIRTMAIPSSTRDLRPAILAISDEISALERRGKRVVVITSETHGSVPHAALRIGVMQQLRRRLMSGCSDSALCPIAYGMEAGSNTLGLFVSRAFNLRLSEEEMAKISARDKDGVALISAYLSGKAPLSKVSSARKSIMSYCSEWGVPLRGNDAAITAMISGGKKLYLLNDQDPLTRSYLEPYADTTDISRIDANSSDGMAIRNEILAQNALKHVEESECRIYFQECGLNHVFGNASSHYEGDKSLTAAFEGVIAHKGMGNDIVVLPILFDDILSAGLDAEACLDNEGRSLLREQGLRVFWPGTYTIRPDSHASQMRIDIFESASNGALGLSGRDIAASDYTETRYTLSKAQAFAPPYRYTRHPIVCA